MLGLNKYNKILYLCEIIWFDKNPKLSVLVAQLVMHPLG